MHSMRASQLALWKNAIEYRSQLSVASTGGTTTRCTVLRHRSLVQHASASPTFTT